MYPRRCLCPLSHHVQPSSGDESSMGPASSTSGQAYLYHNMYPLACESRELVTPVGPELTPMSTIVTHLYLVSLGSYRNMSTFASSSVVWHLQRCCCTVRLSPHSCSRETFSYTIEHLSTPLGFTYSAAKRLTQYHQCLLEHGALTLPPLRLAATRIVVDIVWVFTQTSHPFVPFGKSGACAHCDSESSVHVMNAKRSDLVCA